MAVANREYLACFSLGSNLGDRIAYLEEARMLLEKRLGRLANVSSMYESPAWGYESEQSYVNCCLGLYTQKNALLLVETALEIEEGMGRRREGQGYSDRVIDIDLLLMEEQVVNTPRLVLPHPRMDLRRFVLEPLAEIYPEMKHPVSGLSISSLLDSCPDQSSLIRL